jgi:hypothetical protein
MVCSTSTPTAIKTPDFGNNNAVQALLSSDEVFPVHPMVYDIANILPWILALENYPLSFAYQSVAINLLLVCDWQSPVQIHPYDAHFRVVLVVEYQILCNHFILILLMMQWL